MDGGWRVADGGGRVVDGGSAGGRARWTGASGSAASKAEPVDVQAQTSRSGSAREEREAEKGGREEGGGEDVEGRRWEEVEKLPSVVKSCWYWAVWAVWAVW